MPNVKHPVMLLVLDGWGESADNPFDAIHAAHTPVWDRIWSACPHTLIRCSGVDVGLPDQQMGNSEVGHMHIGAGRLIDQDLSRISKAVASGEFLANPVLRDACANAANNGHAVHVLGLCSPGGVHSHEDHMLALVDLARAAGVREIFVHAFLDGRDTPPQSAAASLERVGAHCATTAGARIASIVGRYFAMDRNNNWSRVAEAYRLIVDGAAEHRADDAIAGLQAAYARGETDEFVHATVIAPAGAQPHRVNDGDVVIFANFRADRARQITQAMTAPAFDKFDRERVPTLAAFVTMTSYSEAFDLPVAYPSNDLANTFGAVVSAQGLKQLRISETEKYAHVTFFFNGGEERVFEGEDRILIPSPDVPTYDLKPEMSAREVADALVGALDSAKYDAIVCNFANADMVGHTGNFEATVKCIEVLDECLGRVLEAARRCGYDVLITADHGNAEKMREGAGDGHAGEPHTAHTSNRVPFVFVGRAADAATDGSLADIAPTMLTLMGLDIPREMTGHTLVHVRTSAQHAA